MPGKGLLSSLTNKAQQALSQTPLAGKLGPLTDQPAASSTTGAPSKPTGAPTSEQQAAAYTTPAQEQSGTLSGRHYGLETISHQLRSLQVQYS